jgi:hypothetical protein
VGEVWGYRASARDALVPVKVLKEGTRKPSRVQVVFEAEGAEGRTEWVPPVRLKVLWSEAAEYEADEARTAAVGNASALVRDSPEWIAAEYLFEEYVDPEIADVSTGWPGVARVRNVPGLAVLCGGVPEDVLTGDDLSYHRQDGLWVPWRVTELLCRGLVGEHAREVLDYVHAEEAKADREAILGHTYYQRGSMSYIRPETCAAVDATYRPARAVLREWAGAPARDQFAELVALREEVLRLGGLVESAAAQLHRAGAVEGARQLEADLGIPLDDIRAQAAAQEEAEQEVEQERRLPTYSTRRPDSELSVREDAEDPSAAGRTAPSPPGRAQGDWGRHWSQR